ncbi:hypothetical protein OAS86_05715 [Gammaproteobacteria bacterium]|nr:hypothetical protein [Gammaproteobacteria bacterium]
MSWTALCAREHRVGTLLALLLLCLAAIYYSWSAMRLPVGAGPDEPHNIDASRFYAEHQRMAYMPDDGELVRWSPYGTSRTMRPPLPFMTSALISRLSGQFPDEPRSYRWSSVLAMLAMLAIGGYAAAWMSGSTLFAATAMAIVAFWPQVQFIASYHNDDALAMAVSALAVLAMVWILKRGTTTANTLLTAAIGGMMLASKLNVWFGALPLIAIWAWGLRYNTEILRRPVLWLSVIALLFLGGGWWIVDNVVTYGIDDPLQRKMVVVMEAEHTRISNPRSNGYLAQHGLGFFDVLTLPEFWVATYKSTIGNLDWLKIKLGPVQYIPYAVILLTLAGYVLYRIGSTRPYPTDVAHESRGFAIASVLWLLMYLALYVAFNTWGDIQLQGRYLFPVLPALIVLLSQLLTQATSRMATINQRWICGSVCLVALAINAHGLTRYVTPYYQPREIVVDWNTEVTVDWQSPRYVESVQDVSISRTADGWLMTKTGPDPQIVLGREICWHMGYRAFFNLVYRATTDDVLQFFWDNGGGYHSDNSFTIALGGDDTSAYGMFAPRSCLRLRIDPFVNSDSLAISEFTLQGIRARTRW